MNIEALLKARQAWRTFNDNHPKFYPFLNALFERGIQEGSVVDVTVSYPDGSTVKTNLAVKESDLMLLDVLKSLRSSRED